MSGSTFTLTPDETGEVFARLQPYLPPYLKKIEIGPLGWGLRFEFVPFTGCEDEPVEPASSYGDPRLTYVLESEDAVEHRLRTAARTILADLFSQAREEWKGAAYVVALRRVVKDAPARWWAYEREAKALESAYAYLRAPQAAAEWPSAISRLVDAQERALAAAAAFDERAVDIAQVHYEHLYADLGPDQALAKAGYPEAKDWHVGDGFGGCFRDGLADKVRRLIEEQEAHLAKVSRLSGITG
ncbi:hypothetical protein [Streptomyces sp. NPDC056160]|uniref:hypothetical protein n=1 Tax=Streptomyces sp. NPDC056160 TaxID=3345731 RepID=UPI0035E2BD52